MLVAFVTTADAEATAGDVDLQPLLDVFSGTDIEIIEAPWEDDSIDWDVFDLVIIRSTWNYTRRLAEFRAWLESQKGRSTLRNPAELIEWTMDKRYLRDLAGRGVPVVPTVFVDVIEQFDEAIAEFDGSEIVIKPTVSAGSRLTGRFAAQAPAASELAAAILAEGLSVMVQPFIASVDLRGEIGTVLFDGEISHSFGKGAILEVGGGFIGGTYDERIVPAVAHADVLEVVGLANREVERIARERGWLGLDRHLLHARYDVLELDDGSFALLEAELFEPSTFVEMSPGADRRYRAAVEAHLHHAPGSANVS